MIRTLLKAIKPAGMCFVVMTILCGVVYPGITTGIAQVVFPVQANGSMITVNFKDGTQKAYGSVLIAQEFTRQQYLIGRPIGSTNLSPVGDEQEKRVQQRVAWWHTFNMTNNNSIPMDLVTASGSGVDPNISPAAAEYQIARVARERNISEDAVREIVSKYTTRRFLGFWGEPAVNVLKVNLALDGLI